jgi:cytochrome b561
LLRTWEAWDPADQAQLEYQFSDLRVGTAALAFYYALVALAVAGFIVMRRRGRPLAILLTPVVLVSLVSIASYGSTRFRAAAEVSLVVLAGVALDAALRALAERRRETSAGDAVTATSPSSPVG